MSGPRPTCVLISLGCLYAVGLALFGAYGHPIPVWSAENDDYVRMAETILAGALPRDPYRPMLYPLLTAALGAGLGDCFAAAKLISAVAAGGFVVGAFVLVRACVGVRAAVIAALLLACNGHVLVHGVLAATDMLFAAWVAAALVCAARVARGARTRVVVLAGAMFAGAYFTRYQAIALLVALVPAIWIGSARRARVRRLLAFAGAACAGLLPHFVLSTLVFGSPLHAENWRNVALKYFGDMDFSGLGSLPFDGPLDVLTHDPLALASGAASTLAEFVTAGVAPLLQGGGAPRPFGFALAVVSVLGAVLGWRSGSRPFRVVVAFGAAFVVATCVAFLPWPRLVLPVLPVFFAGVGLAWARCHRLAPRAALVAGVLVVALTARYAAGHLRWLVAAHPWAEVAAARELVEAAHGPVRIAGTYEHTPRIVECVFVHIRGLPIDRTERADYLPALRRFTARNAIDFVVFGQRSMDPEAFARLCEQPVPESYAPVRRDEDVLVLRCLD